MPFTSEDELNHWKQEAAFYKNDYQVEQKKRLALQVEITELKKLVPKEAKVPDVKV